ncbi:MAG: alpha/beta fold hydrolase [Gemmatimonadetes bacterium]|nr:alpha/beta fold hydrolase [Gemmatimonadota bacterium]
MRLTLKVMSLAALASAAGSTVVVAPREEDVQFVVDGDTLAGTLSLPDGIGPFPAVVLISGGAQDDRDARWGQFRPFKILADSLSAQGVAVLRYDDRGIGRSGGRNTWQYTPEQHAEEPIAALRHLRGRQDIDPRRVGLLGHSYGTLLAAMAAHRGGDPHFVVLLAPVGLPYGEVQAGFQQRNLLAARRTIAEADDAAAFEREVFGAAVRGELDWGEVETRMRDRVRHDWNALTDSVRTRWVDFDRYFSSTWYATALPFGPTPWMRGFWDLDPRPFYRQLTAPVLAVFGGGDTMCTHEESWPPLQAALAVAGIGDVTDVVIPGANHFLQVPRISRTDFARDVVPTIVAWITSRASP